MQKVSESHGKAYHGLEIFYHQIIQGCKIGISFCAILLRNKDWVRHWKMVRGGIVNKHRQSTLASAVRWFQNKPCGFQAV